MHQLFIDVPTIQMEYYLTLLSTNVLQLIAEIHSDIDNLKNYQPGLDAVKKHIKNGKTVAQSYVRQRMAHFFNLLRCLLGTQLAMEILIKDIDKYLKDPEQT